MCSEHGPGHVDEHADRGRCLGRIQCERQALSEDQAQEGGVRIQYLLAYQVRVSTDSSALFSVSEDEREY